MKAIVQRGYGPPEEVLAYEDVEVPHIGPNDVRVRVTAAALNAYDWHFLLGEPLFMRLVIGRSGPDRPTPGRDLAGIVEEVGGAVTSLSVGDRVVGYPSDCLAEQVVAPADEFVLVPDEVELEQAAGLAMAGLTALQALRDEAAVEPGQSVLVLGASGGVGSFVVQLAVDMGARVTGVCSTRNLDLARSLGASDVVDYTAVDVIEELTALGRRFDVVVLVAGRYPGRDLRRLVAAGGIAVNLTGDGGRLLGPLPWMVRAGFAFAGRSQRWTSMTAHDDPDDLLDLLGRMAQGRLRTVVDRTYPLADGVAALRHQLEGHTRGKVLVVP